MAYNQQSSYGASPNRSYHPQQRIYEAQQQYATPHNNYGSGDTRFDVVGHPPYQTPQPLVNEQFGSQDGNSRDQGGNLPQGRGGRGGNNGYDLRTRQTDVRSPDRDMRRVPPPRQPFEPERQVYPNSRSQEESQPHTASIDGPEESQYSQHDQYFRHRGIKRPQLPYSELSAEPTFHHGKTGNPINDLSAGSEYDQSRDGRPLQHMHSAIVNGNTNQSNQITVSHPQQDFADSYRQEIYHGRSTPVVELAKATTTQSQPGPEHYSGADASLNTAAVPFNNSSQQRILNDSCSPNTIGWDNPFPAFGAKKKMAPSQKQQDLNNSVSLMSIKNDSRYERDATERPQTSSSKGSQTSSLTGGSKIFDSDIQKGSPSSSSSRRTADSQFKLDDRKAHPYTSEHKVAEPSESHKTFVTAQPINRTNSPIVHGRRSEDTRTRPFPTVAPKLDPQRSKTMPNNISEVAQDFSLRRGYENQPIWQEPGPTAGYHGPEVVISPRSTPIHTSERPTDRLEIPVNEMRVAQEGEEVLARGQPPRSQHSAQNSLGEFYDSYYHDSQHDVQASAQDQRNQQPHSPDDEMPNFDAVLETKHRRGISIDFHLQPQPLPQPHGNHSKTPQALTQSQRTNTLPSRPNVHVAGQFSKSKSQPNLKDPRPHRNPHDNGFVFDLPGEVPPIPPLSPMRPNFGPQHSVAGTYPTENRQFGVKESRFPADQRGASPDARSKGSAVLNEPLERTSRKGTPLEHHRLSPSQGDGSRGVQVRNPGGRHSPASARKVPPIVTSSNPDSLPPHPTPIRPGLMQVTSSPQAAKPPPMRQYDTNASPLQQPISNQKLGPGHPSNVGGETIPVTHEELEKLRQAVKSHPADQKTQLLLARKLVEAASVLADDGGRADQKARAKNREKYILDAHKIVKKLVSGHSTEATFYLADCYSRGLLGLEVNTKEAFHLYQTAAKSGHAQSAYRVAVCCEMGQEEGGGTKKDPTKAMQWYQRAATLGDTPAMYKLGIIRLKGLLGQSKNPDEALKWLKRAADQANEENPHALHELGLLYEGVSASAIVPKDDEYSKQLFTQAAKLGYKFSQFRLGCAYEYGLLGCPIDPRKSIAWYSKAAVQEEHQSELALSGWYLTGSEGVLQQSDMEAYLWARKAAQAGLAKAEYAMGYFTEVGIGAPANIEDAKRWYWRSASQNFPKARDRLEALRKGGAKMEKSRVSRTALRKQSEGECVVM